MGYVHDVYTHRRLDLFRGRRVGWLDRLAAKRYQRHGAWLPGALEFDPQGSDPSENPDEVPFAYDGNPKTRWRTRTRSSTSIASWCDVFSARSSTVP